MDRICVRALLLISSVAAGGGLSSKNGMAQTAGTSSQAHSSDSVQHTQPSTEQPAALPISANAPHISKPTRFEIIRDFETQLVYARTSFPMGTKGLQLKEGVITPNGVELQQALNLWGPAVKPGDPAHISFVQIKNDHIHFEINGGPQTVLPRTNGADRLLVRPSGSPKTVAASSNETSCLARFVAAFCGSQSNSNANLHYSCASEDLRIGR